jgi:hypothetical protein
VWIATYGEPAGPIGPTRLSASVPLVTCTTSCAKADLTPGAPGHVEGTLAGYIYTPARGTAPDAFRRIEMASIPIIFVMRRLPASRIPAVNRLGLRG